MRAASSNERASAARANLANGALESSKLTDSAQQVKARWPPLSRAQLRVRLHHHHRRRRRRPQRQQNGAISIGKPRNRRNKTSQPENNKNNNNYYYYWKNIGRFAGALPRLVRSPSRAELSQLAGRVQARIWLAGERAAGH